MRQDRGWGPNERDRYDDRDRQAYGDARAPPQRPEYEPRDRRGYFDNAGGRRPSYDQKEQGWQSADAYSGSAGGRRDLDPRDHRARRSPPGGSSGGAPTGPRNRAHSPPSSHMAPKRYDVGADSRHPQQRGNEYAYSDGPREQQAHAAAPPLDIPPTGPRRSFAPPPALSISATPPPRSMSDRPSATPHRPSYDQSAVQAQQERMSAHATDRSPLSASTELPSAGFAAARRSGSHLQLPPQSMPHSAPLSTPTSVPGTPAATMPAVVDGRRTRWDPQDIRGSLVADKEAAAYTRSLERIRSLSAFQAQPQIQALRKALHDVADADVELAGARTKAALTEAALERAKEQADAWSIESGRLELEYRNKGSQAFWTPVTAPSSAQS